MYEDMKLKVENVVDRGQISAEYIANENDRKAFDKWSEGFTRHDHPTVIQVVFQIPNFLYILFQ